MKRTLIFCLPVFLLCILQAASAGTREDLLRLQSDVNAMQAQIRDIDRKFDERYDGIKSLVVQLNDQVAKSSLILDRIARSLESQAAGTKSNDQAFLQEVHNLSLKMDDVTTRLSALAQQVNDLKVQAKAIATEPAANSVVSPQSIFDQAYSDYVQGNFDLAAQGFSDYLRNNPASDKTAAAQFYLGDSYAQQSKISQAITAFTRVINDFPDAEQAASALYKRGRAELQMKESDNAIADFRAVVDKFPAAPEAERAKDELRKLGVSITKPAAAKEPRRRSK